jgi:hypothetical protein
MFAAPKPVLTEADCARSRTSFTRFSIVEPKLVLTQASWESPNIIRIPFTLSGTLITVRGRIDSVEGNFIFDTGASKLLVNKRHFQRSGFFEPGAVGVTGRVRILGALRVDTLQVDNLISTKFAHRTLQKDQLSRHPGMRSISGL